MSITSVDSRVHAIALQLTITRGAASTAGVQAMATLISATEAIAPNHVVGSLRTDSRLAVRLGSSSEIPAAVLASDPRADLAVLQLSSPLPFPEQIGLKESMPESGEPWVSFVITPDVPDGTVVSGVVKGHRVDAGVDHLRLSSEAGLKNPAGSSGAPVVVGELVAGVLAAADEEGREWYALPVTREGLARLKGRAQPADAIREPGSALDANYFFAHLSPSSYAALGAASSLQEANGQDRMHMEHVVMGLFLKEHGPAQRLFSRQGIGTESALRKLLDEVTDIQLPEPGTYTVRTWTAAPRLSRHVQEAFVHAQTVASSRNSPLIRSRHLLYGVLSVEDCKVVQALVQRGLTRDRIQLDEPQVAVTPIVGADSDAPGGTDRLGLKREIEALSALVASRFTKTPLSIGLFGNWGSGKSFFMQKMDAKIREFRETARADEDSPYCSNIVQLWFNAWHYIDKSLWASLGAEIFEGLAHALTEVQTNKEGRSQLEDVRTGLLVKRVAADSARAQAKAAASQSAAELTAQNAVVERIESRTDRDIERALGTRAIVADIWQVTKSQPEVKAALDEAAQKLGWSELTEQSAKGGNQVKEILAIGSFWQSLLTTARNRSAGQWWIAAAAVAGLSVLLAQWLLPLALRLQETARWTLSVLTAATLAAAPMIRIARHVSNVVSDARKQMKTRIEAAREAELGAAKQRRDAAAAAAESKQRDLAACEEAVKKIDDELEALKPTRQFIDFIRNRNQSDEYTRHFGVIARARQDFEELTRLMQLVRDTPAGDGASPAFPPVERIVLYIDDLDRCPEDKVFEVLQAVHLLLAFPLFVVVVGVDPRWLFHSLRARLQVFSGGSDDDVPDEEQRARWQSTPLNYLEKIFQIPFTLRPMADIGYEQLIDELTKAQSADEHVRRADQSARDETSSTADSPTPRTMPAPVAAPGGAQPDKEVSSPRNAQPNVESQTERIEQAKQTHERLNVTEWEAEQMKRLYALIPTPRAAKRYVNVYRLLRGLTSGEERMALIGNASDGGYRSVLLLLAMITGYPVEAAEVMRELLERLPQPHCPENWWDFVDAIRASREEGKTHPTPKWAKRSKQTAPMAAHETSRQMHVTEDAYRWEELFHDLDSIRKSVGDNLESKTMGKWAAVVARYSFASGRLLVAESALTVNSECVP